MDQREENILARLHNVGNYLKRHPETVAGVGALLAAATAYAAILNKLPAPPEAAVNAGTTGTPQQGATQAKQLSRTALVAPATAMLHALALYFRGQYAATGEMEHQQVAAEMTLKRPADLKDNGMPTGQLQRLLSRALGLLADLPKDALVPFNHDAAKIEKFTKLAGRYGAVAEAPRTARDDVKTMGETFADLLKAGRNYIKTDLLPAVGLLADDNETFVKGFKQANRQDDRRGGQKPRKPKTDTSTTNPANPA